MSLLSTCMTWKSSHRGQRASADQRVQSVPFSAHRHRSSRVYTSDSLWFDWFDSHPRSLPYQCTRFRDSFAVLRHHRHCRELRPALPAGISSLLKAVHVIACLSRPCPASHHLARHCAAAAAPTSAHLLVLPGRELSTEVDLEAFVSLM